ncbi:MAG: U32 family peptidase [Candidatus Pacearchaeota archaeon]|nr:U32 family peptidase [Candidatus Pacearchaeota archaeon]
MKQESSLTIPCHWDIDVLEKILEQNKGKNISVKEMYGVSNLSPIRHGRNPLVLDKIKESEMLKFRELLKINNIDFAYILNSPLTDTQVEEGITKIKEHIKWVLSILNPDSLIITSLKIMKIVREISKIPITISTIARVQNTKELEKYLDIKPSKLVLQHDVNRNFKELNKLIEFASKKNISIEIMLTESCRRRCPLMVDHYNTVGKGEKDTHFHRDCNLKKISSPEEFLLANFIRPEDVYIYEKLGIKHFKITGRSKNSSWLPEVVNAYLKREFSGNLIRLLGIDPCLSAEEWIYISNPALTGFLDKFPKTGNPDTERGYCSKWIKQLYLGNKFYIKGIKYKLEEGNLIPDVNINDNLQIKKAYFNEK